VIVEPFHVMGGVAGLKGYLTPELLFRRGFSYAGIGWHPDGADPFSGYSTEEAVQILRNFAIALREDPGAAGMVGDLQQLYAVGVSLTTQPLLAFLDSPDAGLLDFTFLFVPSWSEGTYTQPEESNNIMVFLTEWDLVDSARWSLQTDALRGSSPTYRSYEIAGGSHVPDVPWIRELVGTLPEHTSPLDWTPVARALFLAGHRWTTDGVAPPPSAYLAEAPPGEIDPVYQEHEWNLVTGIARDENGNALRGIRLPDLEIGRGQYIAFDPDSFSGWGLFGKWNDLKCDPLPDGRPRFRSHLSYVRRFTRQTLRLVRQRYLLPQDALRLIWEAAASDVGKPDACDP
jgi:hypothetical protein